MDKLSQTVIDLQPDQADKKYADKVLKLALDIGSNILRSGGEINRAENTIERICHAYGAESTEVFAITSIVSASLTFPGGVSVSQSRRITGYSNDLTKIEKLNAVSRQLCEGKVSLEEASELTESIISNKPSRGWTVYLGGALAAGSFAMFFGGSVYDGILALLIGLIIIAMELNKPAFINQTVQTIISSFTAGAISLALNSVGLPISYDHIMIGVIMLLIPGLAIGNALRELLVGDIISGALRIIQSVLLAVLIAFGYAAAFMLFGGAI